MNYSREERVTQKTYHYLISAEDAKKNGEKYLTIITTNLIMTLKFMN